MRCLILSGRVHHNDNRDDFPGGTADHARRFANPHEVNRRHPARILPILLAIAFWLVPVQRAAALITVGVLDTLGRVEGVEVVGQLAYVADGSSGLRIIDFGPEYSPGLEVEIDIEPWSEENLIDPFSRLLIPVALLGSDGFDVADVDVTTLAFGPGGAEPAFDLTNPFVYWLNHWDVNGDGKKDLLSFYRTPETGIALGTRGRASPARLSTAGRSRAAMR